MKFDGPGKIGYHAGEMYVDSFAQLMSIRSTGVGYCIYFKKANGCYNSWCVSTMLNDFIEIDDIRYVGDKLKEFCEVFIQMYETENAIDSL